MTAPQLDDDMEKQHSEAAELASALDNFLRSAWNSGYRSLSLEPGADGEFNLRAKLKGSWITPADLAMPEVPPNWLIARIKVMAYLDIGQKHAAQNGLIEVVNNLDGVQAMVEILPTRNGELITIHLAERRIEAVSFSDLDLPKDVTNGLQGLFKQRGGIVLMAGPSGHGRMATLYALAEQFLLPEKRLFSAEVAPLRELKGVPNASILKYAGLNYDKALANIRHHGPEAVLVGELVNIDTAKIAFELAGDGVWILSRLSVERPGDAIKRLLDMGIDPLALGSSLSLLIGQRQVRLLCPNCKHSEGPGPYGWLAVGCEACDATGYQGQQTLFEAIAPDSGFRDLMIGFSEAWEYEKLEEYLETAASKSLRQQALELAEQGLTTLVEAALKTPKSN